jgi:hypothetical protein
MNLNIKLEFEFQNTFEDKSLLQASVPDCPTNVKMVSPS